MSGPTLDALHTRLLVKLESGEAAAEVDRALRRPDELAAVVSRSYAHPNGFRKLVISTSNDGTQLRVHHWPTDAEPSNVHNHRWPLASAVMAGQLHSALFEAATAGNPVERYRFLPGEAGGRYTLLIDGRGMIRMTSVAKFGPGTSYALNASQLHRVRAERGTCTIVLSGPAERESTDVYRSSELAPQSRDLLHLPVDAVRESLALLACKLRGWGA